MEIPISGSSVNRRRPQLTVHKVSEAPLLHWLNIAHGANLSDEPVVRIYDLGKTDMMWTRVL